MRPRWNKVLADLWSNKVRSLLVIASIAVGLFAVGMIYSLHVILTQDLEASYLKVNAANIQVKVASFDEDFVDRIRHLPGIRAAEGVYVEEMRLITDADHTISISIKAIPQIDKTEINRLRLIEGVWPPQDHEIVLETNKIKDTGARVGDWVQIKLPSGTIRRLKVVGVVHDQTIGSSSGGGGYFLAPAQGYITFETLPWLEHNSELNLLYATITGDALSQSAIEPFTQKIVDEFKQNGYQTLSSVSRASNNHPNSTYIDAISGILFILGLLVVFLSGFLITNTLSALLNQQIEQVGVMKTVGASRRQITGIYIVLILIYSLLALIIAVPLANLAAFAEVDFLAGQINFVPQGARSIPSAVALQCLIALFVPPLAGSIPILQGVRITIQEALSGIGDRKDEPDSKIYRLLSRFRGLSRPLMISLRNTFRRRLRLILTLTTLILSGATFIATFNVRNSLDAYINRLGKYFIADVNLTFDQPYRIDEIQRVLTQMPEVVSVEGWAAASAELLNADDSVGESVQLQGPPANSSLIEPMMLSGRWIQPGDDNVIVFNDVFADQYPAVKLGDSVRLKVNGKKSTWKVVGFFQFAGKNTGVYAYADYDYLSRLMQSTGRSVMYRVVAADGWHSLKTQEELGRRLERYLSQQGYKVRDVRAGLSLQESTSGGLNTLTTFLLIMALLMAVVGSIGLTGTMSLNVMERTREIGIMRAIGASDRAIMNQVIVEGMLIGSISWLIGCILAIPISILLSDAISIAIFYRPIDFSFTPTGILIWLGVVLGLSVLASVVPARSAARLTIREVLAYE